MDFWVGRESTLDIFVLSVIQVVPMEAKASKSTNIRVFFITTRELLSRFDDKRRVDSRMLVEEPLKLIELCAFFEYRALDGIVLTIQAPARRLVDISPDCFVNLHHCYHFVFQLRNILIRRVGGRLAEHTLRRGFVFLCINVVVRRDTSWIPVGKPLSDLAYLMRCPDATARSLRHSSWLRVVVMRWSKKGGVDEGDEGA